MMKHQALNYIAAPARDYPTYFRDVKLYYQDLRSQVHTFDAPGCIHAEDYRGVRAPETRLTLAQSDGIEAGRGDNPAQA